MESGAGPNIGLFAAVLLVGAAQGLFLAAAVLFAPRNTGRANVYLAAFVMAFVLELLTRFFVVTGYVYAFPRAVTLNWALDFLFGPLIFLYTVNVAGMQGEATAAGERKHFILPVLAVAAALLISLSSSAETFRTAIESGGVRFLSDAELAIALASAVSMVVYVIACFRVLRRHEGDVARNFSFREKTSLAWLRNLLLVVTAILLIYLVAVVVEPYRHGLNQALPLAIVVAVFGIGFLGIRQPVVFSPTGKQKAEFVLDRPAAEAAKPSQYERSALSRDEALAVFRDIDARMDADELFRIGDLSLPMLSDRLGLPSHYVSQAINQGSGKNFFEFVNKRRIDFVRQRLAAAGETGRVNVLDTALDAGFNSKSAFYAAFKAHTGMTPREYRKSLA